MTRKDRPAVAPFTIPEAELLISRLHADWGEAIGNYDEFRFFTGLRPSEQIALLEPITTPVEACCRSPRLASCDEIRTAPRRLEFAGAGPTTRGILR